MNGKRNWAAPLSAVALAVVLSACGGGGDSGNSDGSGATPMPTPTPTPTPTPSSSSFPFTRYDVYGLYSATTNSGSGPVVSISASKGAIAAGGSFAFRSALAGGDTNITLATDSITLSTTIVSANDLSWMAPGADGQLLQQCSVVRADANGAATTAYPKSMLVMVANTAGVLSKVSDIPGGTRLFAAEDCKFSGSSPTGDIAAVSAQNNDSVLVNADGSLTLQAIGVGNIAVSAADVAAALSSGGTGLAAVSGIPVPSAAGKAGGSYALHAYSLPRSGKAARYVLVIQATPTGGNVAVGSRGVVAMWVSP